MATGWGANRDPATRADVNQTLRESAAERQCPNCNRKGALKVRRYDNPILVKMHGFIIVDRRCRYCDFSDTYNIDV